MKTLATKYAYRIVERNGGYMPQIGKRFFGVFYRWHDFHSHQVGLEPAIRIINATMKSHAIIEWVGIKRAKP